MAKQSFDIHAYARAGAQARLAQLGEEVEQIGRLFPELRSHIDATLSGRVAGAPGAASSRRPGATKLRRPRTMSAAGRKRISDAQKARWAARRAATASQASAAPAAATERTPTARKKR